MADLTANMIVHYMLAIVLLVLAPFLQSWTMLIFIFDCLLHFSVGFIVHNSEGIKLSYLHRSFPKARLLVIWAILFGNVARWELGKKLLFGWQSREYYAFFGFEVSCCIFSNDLSH